MLDVVTTGMLWSLNASQVLVLAFTAFQDNPVISVVALVLVTLDKVPTKNKVLRNIIDARADNGHGNVMPGHAAIVGLADFILLPVLNILKVHDAVVVEVLAGPDLLGDTFGVGVGQRVLMGIPAAKAQIQASDEGNYIIDNNKLFVMSPEHGGICRIFKGAVVRVSDNANVAVSG